MNTSVMSAPRGMARAAEDTNAAEDIRRREADKRLTALQTAAARRRRIEKSARRDPATEELLEEHTALKASVTELRSQLQRAQDETTRLTAAYESLQTKLTEAQARNVQLEQQLGAATKSKR